MSLIRRPSRWNHKSRTIRRNRPLFMERLEDRCVPATVTWTNPGSGSWDNTANWSTGQLPQPGDDVAISTAAAAAISLTSGDNISVDSLTLGVSDTFTIAHGSSLNLAASSNLNGFLIDNGQIDVNGGTLQIAGGSVATGSINVAGGAQLLFAGVNTRTVFESGASITGAGTVQLNGSRAEFVPGSTYTVTGTTDIAGGTLVLNGNATIGTLIESSGQLDGAATVAVTGSTTWTGGVMAGPGSTDAQGGLVLGVSGAANNSDEILAGRTLINESAATWYAKNSLTQEESSTFENSATGTITVNGSNGWAVDSVANDKTGSFDNEGNLVVNAGIGTTTTLQVSFSNKGNVEINSGTLDLGQNGTIGGSIDVSAGATLQLANANRLFFVVNPGASISGAGAVVFGATSAVSFAAGSTYDVTGTTTVNEGNDAANVIVFNAGSTVTSLGGLTISSGSVDFSTGNTITAASLTESGGTLKGSDSVVVTGVTTWTGGNMSGSGKTTASGGLSLGLNDGSDHAENLDARTFVNANQATWIGSGQLKIDAGGQFINQAGQTFTIQNSFTTASGKSATATTDSGSGTQPSGLFDNQGKLMVQGGVANMDSRFNNEGQVEVSSGIWELVGNGVSSGTFVVDSGTTINLNSFYNGGSGNQLPPVNLSGAGTKTFNNGSNVSPAIVSGGNLVIPSGSPSVKFWLSQGNTTVSSLTLNAGAFLVVNGTLTVTGQMTWTSGYIAGPGKIIAQGGLTLGQASGGSISLNGATLVNAGTATLFGQSTLNLIDGAQLINQKNATLNLQGGGNDATGDGTGNLINLGTIDAAVGSSSTYSVFFTPMFNSGSISVTSGTLNLFGGGAATGSFSVAKGSTLGFGHDGPWYFNSGSSISGPGNITFQSDGWSDTFASGSTFDMSGATNVSETVIFAAGSNVADLGALAFSGNAFVNLSSGSTVTMTSLNQSAGVLSGSDTLDVTGQTTWTGGTMSGTGTTVAEGGLQVGTSGTSQTEFLLVRTMINSSSAVVESKDTFIQSDNSTFINTNVATLSIQDNVNWSDDHTSVIANDGTITVAVASQTKALPDLDNTGSVQVAQGNLLLGGGGIARGTYSIAAGGTMTEGTDAISPISVAFPLTFTANGWNATFSGTASDASGSGLASVGLSFFDGKHYFDGTAFESSSPVYVPAILNGSNWTLETPVSIFSNDTVCTVASRALDEQSGVETSTITSLVLAQFFKINVSMTAPQDGTATNNNKPTLSANASETGGTGLASVQLQYSSDGGNTWNNAGPAQTASPFTYTFPTSLLDGTYEARAIATDNANNSATSSVVSFQIDTVAPIVSMTAPAEGSATNTTPTLTATASDNSGGSGLANVQFQYSSDGGNTWNNAGSPETNSPFSFTFTNPLPLGHYEARAIAMDRAGNTTTSSPVSFFVDTTIVNVTMTAPTNGTITNINKPKLSATATANPSKNLVNVQFQISSNGGTTWSNVGPAETVAPFAYTFTSPLPDGNYQARAVATDNLGHLTASSPVSFLVDTTAPSATMTSPVTGTITKINKPTLSANASDTLGGSGLASIQFQYSPNGGATWYSAGSKETVGPFSYTFTSSLADGHYQARAVATDKAGNSAPSPVVSFTIDATAPTVYMTAPGNGTIISNNKPSLTAIASDATSGLASVQFQFSTDGGKSWNNVGGPESAAPFSYTFTNPLADGPYDARAVAIDNAGNTTTSAVDAFAVKFVPASPTLTITPGGTVALGSGNKLTASVVLANGSTPGGTITFTLFAPDGKTVVDTETVPVNGNGTYKTPAGYLPTAAGAYQWQAAYSGDSSNKPATSVKATESVTMGTPTITPTPGATVVLGTGARMSSSATLASGFNPTGTITFVLHSPASTAVDTEKVTVTGNGVYSTVNGFVPTIAGTYHWVASYSGDSNNKAVSSLPANGAEVAVGAGVTVVGSNLYLVGGSGADAMQVVPAGASATGSTGVTLSGVLNGVAVAKTYLQSFTNVLYYGFGGNDTLQMANSLTIATAANEGDGNDYIQLGSGNNSIFVGNGNDYVQAGTGNNVIVTGNGNDFIQAGNGNNLIVAGLGRHNVAVGDGSNILIDGSVQLTQSGDSLVQILADWTDFGSQPNNVASIRSRLQVTDNTTNPNVLIAGGGLDWFWDTYAQDTTNIKGSDLLN